MRDIKDVYLLALQKGMLATHARKVLSRAKPARTLGRSEGSESVTKCNRLKMEAPDWKKCLTDKVRKVAGKTKRIITVALKRHES